MGVQNPRDSDAATPRDSGGPLASGSASSQQKSNAADVYAPNIIIYGETGVGKSSVINLVADQELAQTSNDALGCTFQHQRYMVELDGMPYAIWDTAGLDEGSEGTVPAAMAEGHLKSLIQGLADTGGIHLVAYCIRAARLTKALQHNYDLFYVTVCRKKVPVALVVTGLEHRQGEMEDWWGENEVVLRRYGMRFDAHACVTTLDIEDQVVRQRRLHSQRILRELVVQYSQLPPWKADPSFISSILPMLRTALRKTVAAGKTKKTIPRVITCDMVSIDNTPDPRPIKLSPDVPLWIIRTESPSIGGQPYEFFSMDKPALRIQVQQARPLDVGSGVGALVFYTSPLGNAIIPTEEVKMLEEFYDIAGGQMCPMIVVLRRCDNEERVIRECRNVLASHHKNIQTYFTTLSRQQLNDLIGRLCIERTEIRSSTFHKVCMVAKQLVATVVSGNFRRKHGKIPVDTGQMNALASKP